MMDQSVPQSLRLAINVMAFQGVPSDPHYTKRRYQILRRMYRAVGNENWSTLWPSNRR